MNEKALPEYSVLMSVYGNDTSANLNAAIKSMIIQTVPFYDLVLVCDGSLGDDLDAAVSEWKAELNDRMNIVRLPKNGGLGAALAAGLSECTCNIVARMDADDISRPDRCEKILRKMVEEDLELVGGAIEEFDKIPGDMGSVRMPPLSKTEIDTWLKGRNPFNHVSVMFDRHMVEEVGGYEPFPWMEDYWLWARMIAGGCSCANILDVVVDVRVGEGMYVRRSNRAYLKSQVHFFKELRRLGLISGVDQAKAVFQRTAATVLPSSLVKVVYNSFLRTKSKA